MTKRTVLLSVLTILVVLGAIFPLQAGDIPRSIVLIIADGTGIGQHTMSYYSNDDYAPARFEHVGLMTTHTVNEDEVTDSGASATAMATGVKTKRGAIGVDADNQPRKTVLEHAQAKGMATGLVATATISHATPAAFAAHVESRRDQEEIARQQADASITVLFGGGRKYFLSEGQGGTQDIDLLEQMSAKGIQVISKLDDSLEQAQPVIGLFADEGLPRANEGRSPTTAEMTQRALDILQQDPDGFFLMIEESQVDWAGHDNNEEWVTAEMASLNAVIDVCLEYHEQHQETLILLVADHETGGMAVHGKALGSGYKANWTSRGHSGNMVPIFATGPGSEVFDAVVDNTFIGQTLIKYITAD